MPDHFPDLTVFEQLAGNVDFVPVYRRMTSDCLTPVSAFHRLDQGDWACLFESVIGGEKVGRYSFLTSQPFLQIEARADEVRITDQGETTVYTSEDPLADLQKKIEQYRTAHLEELPPFCGGAIGYAGYDTVRYTEHLPNAPEDDRDLPDLCFAFFDRMVIFDHVQKTIYVIAMAHLRGETDLENARQEAVEKVDQLVDELQRLDRELPLEDIPAEHLVQPPPVSYESNFKKEEFEAAVEACQEYIRAGDIFQVVLSQRLMTEVNVSSFEIYRTLRVVNPSPFMFYLRMPSATLVGSSPEIMVRVVDGVVTVRPLAGTRKRGKTELEDRQLAEELLADPKERAEHVMLVDLGRNDVGRVSQFGSVEISDMMVIERYSHVMHITSNVNGKLRPETTAFDALRACLPAGTVSGAPKVRAMQIIDELEPHRRGPYAGAVGYFDFSGNMDTCIALRTMVVQGNKAYVQAGAGIVADSVPSSEYQETLNKAQGLLKAIALTEHRVGQQTTPE
ncbi:Anthranilate synthase component I [Planctomycetales bacterium 10988]|nr:Anthranilate synthase component I [Planctomycetales bacterium 10988]